jgi:hypothetical protein
MSNIETYDKVASLITDPCDTFVVNNRGIQVFFSFSSLEEAFRKVTISFDGVISFDSSREPTTQKEILAAKRAKDFLEAIS